jgi:hypothetical protein
MSIAAGPFAIGAVLLAIGGLMKANDPNDTATAMRGAGLPFSPWLVRAGALAEAALGAYALVAGDRVSAVLVACSYSAFALFVAVALLRDLPIATCGCFGKADTPPSIVHVGCNVVLAIAAGAVAADPGVGIADVVRVQPMAGVPFLLLVGLGSSLVFLALTSLPRLLTLVRANEVPAR